MPNCKSDQSRRWAGRVALIYSPSGSSPSDCAHFSSCRLQAEQDSDGSAQSTADMTAFVQNLLIQMQTRFQAMSENIISKIDEMGARIDELEQSINDLKAEMGNEGMSMPSKIREESKPSDSSA